MKLKIELDDWEIRDAILDYISSKIGIAKEVLVRDEIRFLVKDELNISACIKWS